MQAQALAASLEAPQAILPVNLGSTVLNNALIFTKLWDEHLCNNRETKRSLRCVRSVLALSDAAVVALDTAAGKHPSHHIRNGRMGRRKLGGALSIWPQIKQLKLSANALTGTVLSGALLPRLQRLTLEFNILEEGEVDAGWSMPALSHAAASGLRELCVMCCSSGGPNRRRPEVSIEHIRRLKQLQSIHIHGCTVDLRPLEGCVQLQKIAIRCSNLSPTSDLTPLSGCSNLTKLSLALTNVSGLSQLQGCAAQVRDLDLYCCREMSSLEGLQAFSRLTSLSITGCRHLTSLAAL
ncbi:hypothetical protein FOA52_011322 [Chlamydomonas sp. UWO 241]|nr:hypothetical protein FOA52_011322 [Chlamydomonas sp. UWO 241]